MTSTNKSHIVWVMANNSSAPYVTWFAERASKDPTIQVSFVCLFPESPKMIQDVGQYGWKCHWLKFDHTKRKRGFIKLIPQLFFLFRKIKPTIVHTHLFDDALPTLLAARLSNVKIRINTKADTSYHYFYHRKWFAFDLFNNFNSTHLVAISDESKKFILEVEKVKPSKVTRIHHGVPVESLTNQSETIKNRLISKYNLKDKIIIGTVARFIEWKGYRFIIEAAETIVKTYPHVLFLFVGQGEQENEVRELIRNKNLQNNIILTGWVDRDDIPSLYGIMDIYIHAASREPFGFVIAEAMVNGVPMVTTKTGAALDAIQHLKNGYLVDEKKSNEIADGVFYLLKSNRKEIGQAAKKTALEMYTFEVMYTNHINLYNKLLRKEN